MFDILTRFNHVWPFWYFIHTFIKRCLSRCQLLIMSRVKANTWRGFLCPPTLPRYPTPSSFTAPKTTFKQSQFTTAKVSSSSAIWKRENCRFQGWFFFFLPIDWWLILKGWLGDITNKNNNHNHSYCLPVLSCCLQLSGMSVDAESKILFGVMPSVWIFPIANWLHPYFYITHFHLFECKSCLMGRSSVRE